MMPRHSVLLQLSSGDERVRLCLGARRFRSVASLDALVERWAVGVEVTAAR